VDAKIYKRVDYYDSDGKEISDPSKAKNEEKIVTLVLSCNLLRYFLPKNSTDFPQSMMDFKMTSNYLVIKINHVVICFDFEDIDDMNRKADELYEQRMCYLSDEINSLESIKAKVINIDNFFDQYNSENGIRIQNVGKSDLRFVENSKLRTDCIQITTIDYVMIWDIELNEEVTTVKGYD